MAKCIALLFFITTFTGMLKAQTVPAEVQQIIDDYLTDTTNIFSLKAAQQLGVDTTLKQSDISIGIPMQEFNFNIDSLEKPNCYTRTNSYSTWEKS